MKKMICLLLSVCVTFTLAACGGSKPVKETEKTQESTSDTVQVSG